MILTLNDPASGCPGVKSCTYELYSIDLGNETFYGYFYVINNQSGCGKWCPNNHNISTCPVNNGTCTVTKDIRRYCYYQGFEELFGCYNYEKYVWSIICITLFICSVLIMVIAAVNIWRNYQFSRYYQEIQ